MKEFLSNGFELSDLYISFGDLLIIIMVLAIASVLSLLSSRWIRRAELFKNWDLRRKRYLFQALRGIFWIAALGSILATVGLDLKGFLNYPLIDSPGETSEFKLTPWHFFAAFIIILVTRILLVGLERVFVADQHFREKESTKSRTVFKFLSYLVWVIITLVILSLTGLNLTILWGAGAALLVGVGFGLQQIIADLISGLFLLFEGNLKEGDVVELNNGVIGQVDHVGIRTSKVMTRDDYLMIIPNSQFIVKEVINWTHNEDNTRFHIDVGVAYGSDTRLVEKVLLDCIKQQTDVSTKPSPFVRFNDFGNSSLDFQVYFWSRNNFRIENIKSSIRFRIDEMFRENSITIPFPQRDVHLKKN